MKNNILQYESKVWSTADSLISVGIKQSDFPKFMMPFFALILVESRLLRMKEELEKSGDKLDKEDFLEEMREEGKGYNIYLLEKGKTLKDICINDKTFEIDFDAYLKGFDEETKDLFLQSIADFELKIDGFFNYVKESREGKVLIAKINSIGTKFSEDEIIADFEKIYRKFIRRHKLELGDFFISQTTDIVDYLYNDFEKHIK